MNCLRFILGLVLVIVVLICPVKSQMDTTEAARAYVLGLDFVAQNKFDRAANAFGRAADLFLESGYHSRRAACILQHLDIIGLENAKTIQALKEKFYRSLSQVNDPFESQSLQISMLLYKAENSTNADSIRSSLRTAEVIMEQDDSIRWLLGPKLFLEMGLQHLNNQNLDSARFYFETALPMAKLQSNAELEGDISIRLAQVHRRRGDPQKARNLITEAISHYQDKFGESHTKIAAGYNDLSIVQKSLGEIEASGSSLNKALFIREKLLGRRSNEYGMVLNNIALHYMEVGQLEKAILAAKETVSIFEQITKPDRRFHVSSYNTLAKVYERAGDLIAAQKNYQKTVDLHIKYFPGNSRIRFYYLDLGRNAMTRGKYQDAVKYFHLAMSAALPGIDANNLDQKPSKDDPSNYLSLRSLCLLKATALHKLYHETKDTGNLSKALELYDLADFFATKNRVEVQYKKSREAFSRQNLALYEGAILAYLEKWEVTGIQGFLEASFLLNEKSKSLTLLQNLLDAHAMDNSGIPASVKRQEALIQDSIARLRNDLRQAHNQMGISDLQSIRSQIVSLDFKYEEFKRTLERNYPRYYQSKYDFEFKTLGEIQQQLNPEQSVIEYFVGDEHLIVFTINSESIKAQKMIKPDSVRQYITGLVESLRNFNTTIPLNHNFNVRSVGDYTKYATKLFDMLWKPYQGDMKNEVMIIPDAILNYLPFGVLLSEPPHTYGKFKEYPYLEFEHIISYNYSATLADQMKESPGARSNKVLAIAPTFTEVTDQDLQPLLFNLEEAEAVTDILFGKSLLGLEATGSRFRTIQPDFGIFHFATHAVVDEENPDYSFLAFQPKEGQDRLYLHELYSIDLPAYLVTLSACETNVGPLLQGEGIASLAKGFSYAGTKSLVTSLWDVDDQAAVDIMKAFYREIATKKSKDLALRNAKQQYIKDSDPLFAHPMFWATFMPIGDMSQLQSTSTSIHFLLWPSIVFLLLLIFYLASRKWKNSNNPTYSPTPTGKL